MQFRAHLMLKPRTVLIILGVVVLLCPMLLLLISVAYKASIGYSQSREFIQYYIPSHKVRPLRVVELRPNDQRLTVVSGLPVPADWSPTPYNEKRWSDGGFGVQHTPTEIDTIADLQLLGPKLLDRGYEQDDVENILGKNWIRFLGRALPAS